MTEWPCKRVTLAVYVWVNELTDMHLIIRWISRPLSVWVQEAADISSRAWIGLVENVWVSKFPNMSRPILRAPAT